MLNKIAKFEKVSFEEYRKAIVDVFAYTFSTDEIRKMYDDIQLPKRATRGSAGYDFFTPISIKLLPGGTIKIPTGIRCRMNEDYVLMVFPRSSLGFKFRLQLDNTVGVIDSDYYNAENEGHIFIKMTNDTNCDKTVEVKVGNAFAQGVFLQYGITDDDDADGRRVDGFGSTDKK